MHKTFLCEVIPLTGRQVSFQISGREILRWNAGTDYPRPFFFPVIAPSGAMLTRMGHPGAPDHDHHQSVWYAHNKVLGIDFWGNTSSASIRQLQWLTYEDGDESCRMAVELGWFDGHNPAPLLKQELMCEVQPIGEAGEYSIELQSRFVPLSSSLEFGQSNFGFLAVRVSKAVSAFFGGGVLTGSEGTQTESKLFEQVARWVDYSGSTNLDGTQYEGITYLDHPSNPCQPTRWHVRDDGWMCASPCMKAAITTTKESPLLLRYQLLIHAGPADAVRANVAFKAFSDLAPMSIVKGLQPHVRWQIQRG